MARNQFGVTISRARPFNAATKRNKFGVSTKVSTGWTKYDYGTADERKAVRLRVMERDGYCCRKCGTNLRGKERHVHHVIPLSKGGQNTVANQVLLCVPCHEATHDHMQEKPQIKNRKYR